MPITLLKLMGSESERRKLRDEGVADDRVVWVRHAFSHFGSSREQQIAFIRALRAAGFGADGGEVDGDAEADDEYYQHYWAFTPTLAAPVRLEALDAAARETALAHGVQYDGWRVVRANGGKRATDGRV